MSGILELRVYTLKPGIREAFRRRFVDEIGPMLERFGITVVAALPSLHDQRSFTLIPAFPRLPSARSSSRASTAATSGALVTRSPPWR
jgi:hypothetical protein